MYVKKNLLRYVYIALENISMSSNSADGVSEVNLHEAENINSIGRNIEFT